ncbi:helix-turn-helix transcriptional regulator [Nocardiopsis sp. JB363]|uniref:helix-turn-helix transcriptional regulator n=1 Tax=Nocardiopsis sp. JB363 TaxID=1434837 RepID=UPI001F463505|nr:helix-turn-helix transcriptional regulator [Nocardiopsis sp. JB363]
MVAAVRERDAQRAIQFLRRRVKNLSQEALARMCGVAQSTITRAEAGKGLTDRRRAHEALQGLGAPLSDGHPRTSSDSMGALLPWGNGSLDQGRPAVAHQLQERLELQTVDHALVLLLEQQTQNLRLIDRKLGAHFLLAQSQAHVQQMHDLMNCTLPGTVRRVLARVLAEAASLTAWQALDSGQPATSWRYYETAKAAARESEDPAVLAYVSAEQIYVLMDSDRRREALAIITAINHGKTGSLPPLLRSWLWAAEAEVHAALGEKTRPRKALDRAFAILPSESHDPALPFLMLDQTHLLRWRGHCLARLGDTQAIDDLTASLNEIIPLGLGRTECGLRTDLALAFTTRGEHTLAREQAKSAAVLSERSGSLRQQARLKRYFGSRVLLEGQKVK